MRTSILILITDGKSKGHLEIDGRLDLLAQFLNAVSGGDEKKSIGLLSRVIPTPDTILPAKNPKQSQGEPYVTD
jgi:hypothetical protein